MFFRIVGNLLVAGALVSLAYLAVVTSGVFQPREERAVVQLRPQPTVGPQTGGAPDAEAAGVQAETTVEPFELITHLRMPRLLIDSEVVPSPFVQVDDSGTWEVPAFKVGHAEYTAGAGKTGNSVLFGHVTSRTLGNVFQNLERARRGDILEIWSDRGEYRYEVVDIRRVPRTDVSVVEPTDAATASLITCTGAWLPHLNDYAERLVVRAELIA